MDWDLILLDLILTMFFYLLVPVIFCIRQKPMSEKQINKTIIINGVVVWFIFSIIILSAGGEISSIPAVFFWSWIGKKIMTRVLLKDKESESASKSTNEINDVTDKAAINNQFPQTRYYCSKCGGLIDDNTRKCTGCGKQHSKKLSKTSIVLIIVSILLVIVCVVISLILHIQNTKLNDKIEELEKENQQYYDYWVESFEQIAFFDEFVVFVEDDGTNWYHKYECRRFIGKDFWAFNIDAAIIDGYEPCPFCCE